MTTFELNPWLPYKGCKQAIVEQLYNTIRQLNIPHPVAIKSPFCGGGAFEYYLARKGFKVVASDLDKSLILLHNTCRTAPSTIEQWGREYFTKEEFKGLLTDESAFGAYVRSIWSFGNDGRTYLTSSENEANKIEEFLRGEAEPNSRHRHVEDICLLWGRYPALDITFTVRSYEDVTVEENELCYCDPPYSGTAGYRSGGFDHNKFYEWALAQKGLVLISEYDMPEPFVLVDRYQKWVESGRGARTKLGEERLYANRPVQKLSLF